MTRTAVVVCPGRGTYNKSELGYLHRHHAHSSLLPSFDAIRQAQQQETITALDGAERFVGSTYTRGDIASPLIYTCTLADKEALADDIDVVAVTGNSMGWYSTLAAAGAVSHDDGFQLVNTMGSLMQEHLIGGQLIYPFVDENWRPEPGLKEALMAQVDRINDSIDRELSLSIDLGGMLVLAGNEQGLRAFEQAVPIRQERFPMRLPNHAAFHTHLQAPVARLGRARLSPDLFTQPQCPMIDGRGAIWWPGATDPKALWQYTLDHQVIESYDFTAAIRTAAREFAPDLFIVTGPGNTLGGAVAQALILSHWRGIDSKARFVEQQTEQLVMCSMGLDAQRPAVSVA
ncbi:MAG: ACP S-malonyltransferase [Pseudomonadota bacterium]